MAERKDYKITVRAFLIGAFFAGLFAMISVITENRSAGTQPTSTQIPVLPYVLLFFTVLLINPLFRLIRIIRPLNVAEILLVFLMGMVSSSISTYGLSSQLVPITSSILYRDWDTDQAQWDRYLKPFLDESYFLSEPGINAAAVEYRAAVDLRDDYKNFHERAAALKVAEKARADAEAQPAGENKDIAVRAAQEREKVALAAWEKLRESGGATGSLKGVDRQEVERSYQDKIAEQEKTVQHLKTALQELSEKAAQKVELFRRGLPKEKQAFPGIIPMPEDDASSYFGRFKRMTDGRSALSTLWTVHDQFAGLSGNVDAAAAQKAAPQLKSVIDTLKPFTETGPLQVMKANLETDLETTTQNLAKVNTDLTDLNLRKREVALSEQPELDRQISRLMSEKRRLENEKKSIELRIKGNKNQLEIAGRVSSAMEKLAAYDAELQGGAMPVDAAKTRLRGIMDIFPSFDASYRRYVFGDVPWSHWTGVFFRWGLLIALTYIVLMTFNVLIFRQWAHNEKLIYPLAELPEILVGQKDPPGENNVPGMIPDIFKSGLFWVGLTISGSVLGWNMLAHSNVVPGLQPLDLANYWDPYIQNTFLKGLVKGSRSAIFFTMLGLAFLTPAKVSFSLWFFWIFYLVQLTLLTYLGYGVDETSFPREWYYTMNFCTAQGGGAMMIFASVCLYKARRYIFSFFSKDSVQDLEPDERREIRASSFLFITCSLGLILMLWQGMGASLAHTIFMYAAVMVLTIGLVRAVAEGGILGFQAYSGPFHLLRNLFGFDKSWSTPAMVTPLMIYYSVFFLDIKTFIAPAMATSLKVRDDLRMERSRYHIAVVGAIVIACIVAIGFTIMLSYANGANAMNNWFYNGFPQGMYTHLKNMNQNPPTSSTPQTLWLLTGAATMTLLLYFRQTLFWLPHPIGLIMLVNPLMHAYWFSIFLGWLAKYLVTKYGNRDTYTRTRALFIGLIVGELIIVTLALFFSYYLNVRIPIDLNRNA